MNKEEAQKFIDWTKLKIDLHQSDPIDFYFHERDVWWASLGKNIGFEQNGKNEKFERPVLVVKKFNKHVFWSLPMSSQTKEGKHYYHTSYKDETYSIILSQLRLISSKRLLRKIRKLPEKEFEEVKKRTKEFI